MNRVPGASFWQYAQNQDKTPFTRLYSLAMICNPVLDSVAVPHRQHIVENMPLGMIKKTTLKVVYSEGNTDRTVKNMEKRGYSPLVNTLTMSSFNFDVIASQFFRRSNLLSSEGDCHAPRRRRPLAATLSCHCRNTQVRVSFRKKLSYRSLRTEPPCQAHLWWARRGAQSAAISCQSGGSFRRTKCSSR